MVSLSIPQVASITIQLRTKVLQKASFIQFSQNSLGTNTFNSFYQSITISILKQVFSKPFTLSTAISSETLPSFCSTYGLFCVANSSQSVGSFGNPYPPGKVSAGLYFDGASTVCVNDSPSLRFTQQLLIDVWVRPGIIDNKTRNIVAEISKTEGFAYRLFLRDGQPLFVVNSDQGDGELVATQRLEVGQWAHLVASYDGTMMTITLNDTQLAQKPFNHTIRSTHPICW